MSNSLRSRLYRALPEELIHAPNSHPQSKNSRPAQEDLPKQSILLQNSSHEEYPIKTRRTAAVEADKKISATTFQVTAKKRTFKHGWLEEEQDYEPPFPYSPIPIPQPLDDITSSQNPSSQSDTPYATSESDSQEELAWDNSADQLTLMENSPKDPPNAWTSTPFVRSYQSAIPPAFPRERIGAISHMPLTRSNAFRNPPQTQNAAFLDSQQNTKSPEPRMLRPSRIPKPSNPAEVNLQEVADIALLPNPLSPKPRRSSRRSYRPDYLGTVQQSRSSSRTKKRDKEKKEVATQAQPCVRSRTPART